MKETIYNKLVRDRIIDVINKDGKQAVFRTLSREEHLSCLKDKLLEEAEEYRQSGESSEIADVLEVIEEILELTGVSFAEVSEIREMKALKNGKFRKGYFLEKVIERQ